MAKQYDAMIIGFGKGGKTLAAALAAAGQRVAIAEQSADMYGGTCINAGCIPSKALVHIAERAAVLGGDWTEKTVRYQGAVQQKSRLTATLREKNFHKLADLPNVDVYTGTAKFTGPRQVAVATAGGTVDIQAAKLFINTGATPFIPPIPGLRDSKHAYTSQQLLSLERLPKRLVIIGGGYIGMEFASIYANFGSQVTVIQPEAELLPREDREIAGAIFQSLEHRGVTVLRETQIEAVQDNGAYAVLQTQTPQGPQTLEAEAVLIAAGRRPNVAGLNPEAAGVALTERGAVQTDEHLRTTNPNIWAMGDVAGGLQFTYISLDDFRIVKDQVLGNGQRTTANRGAVPYSVFLDPAFSRVGLTEQEARQQGYAVKIAKLQAAAIPKAQVLQQPTGLLKAVVDAQTNEILGAHLFCAESYEMINIIKLAMDARLPYTVLRDSIFTHPTMSEALNDLFATLQ